jgi:hypothetical protein
VDDLPEPVSALIEKTVQSGEFTFPANLLQLEAIATQGTPSERQALLTQLAGIFRRTWLPPQQSAVETVNAISQYGAWVMIHGYSVNHFTGYVNCHQTEQYKSEMEGSMESGLCQTATKAVTEQVWVQNDATGTLVQIPWPYAYYEIAERYRIKNSSGDSVLFEGFLNVQAQRLFEMTRRSNPSSNEVLRFSSPI